MRAAPLLLTFLCGCAMTQVGVSNPIPSVRRVAVAPFINLSTEPDVDLGRDALFAGGFADRRFAQAYYAELQKVPGFEVIPVGVVDQAIHGLKLPMEGPADYLAVCRAIGADAICVGAVTDFDAYQPRLGMQTQWYALADALPPAPTMPYEREHARENYRDPPKPRRHWWQLWRSPEFSEGETVVCGQSPDGAVPAGLWAELEVEGPEEEFVPARVAQVPPVGPPPLVVDAPPLPASVPVRVEPPPEPDPLYSYTRLFDGRDAALTARLRDYVELSGDLRAGGWEGYLNRSDDFIRFCCHLMITEMLQLHGGESLRRTVIKKRRHP